MIGIVKTKRQKVGYKNWKRDLVRKATKFYRHNKMPLVCCCCGEGIKLSPTPISRGIGKPKKQVLLPDNFYLDCAVPVGCPVDVRKDIKWYCSACWQKWSVEKNAGYAHLKKYEGRDVYYSHDVVQGGSPSLGKRG